MLVDHIAQERHQPPEGGPLGFCRNVMPMNLRRRESRTARSQAAGESHVHGAIGLTDGAVRLIRVS
jgi:hypothetical protein